MQEREGGMSWTIFPSETTESGCRGGGWQPTSIPFRTHSRSSNSADVMTVEDSHLPLAIVTRTWRLM